MYQKYVIKRENGVENKLIIREYAILHKPAKNIEASTLSNDDFSFLVEETYDGSTIACATQEGRDSVVAALRTHNLFPIGPYATKIAESVMTLFSADEDGYVELIFDDRDLFEKEAVLEER